MVEFLKENANAFYRNAKRLLNEQEYKLAAFEIEQSLQLYLKYFLARKIGDFPKTHSLKRLFEECIRFCPEIKKLFEDNINTIGDIEGAYIASRYYPSYYTKREVENMLRFLEKAISVIERCL